MNQKGSLPKLFISYSKEDIAFQKSLLKHLASLRNRIVTWHDQDLLPGEEWDDSIKAKLRSADVVLYLVSHNSIATDYIQNVELPLIEERCQNKECVLIPVIVDFCLWEDLDFAKYNALPNKGLPITDRSWANQNEAWLKVVQGIKRNIEKLAVDRSVTQPSIIIPEQKSVDISLPQPSIVIPQPKTVIIPSVLKTDENWRIIDDYKVKVKDQIALDLKTGLMWLRFSYGQTWRNGTTQGDVQKMSWKTIFDAAEDFNILGGYAGYSDWRLPDIEELKTLINKFKGEKYNCIHSDVFPNNNGALFWSASSSANDGNLAWFVCFNGGYNSVVNKNSYNQIRLVRSGQ